MEVIQRHSALTIGIIICGVLGAFAAQWLIMPTGALAPGIFEAQSSGAAMGVIMFVLVLSTVVAAVVAKFSNPAVGLFALGCGIFVLARRGGTIVDLAFSGGGTALIVVETLLWAALILLATLAVFLIAGPLRDIEPDESGRRPHWLWSNEALTCAAMGALVVPGVWVVAQSFDKGQAVAAVFLGSIAAGTAGRMLSPHVQPILLFAAPCVFGAIGHMIGVVMTGVPLQHGVVAQTISSLNVPMPIDYAAGSLMGVSVGLGWARSMLHHEDVPDEHS